MFRKTHVAIAAVLGLVLIAPASGQSPAPAAKVDLTSTPNIDAGPLVKGTNTLTEKQVRNRLLRAGLSDIADLVLDQDGIWRGRAVRAGATLSVGVDRLGDISTR